MKSICFDWGNTLMVDFPQYDGPMKDWPEVACIPGVEETLKVLHTQYKLYVATNASESSAEDVKKALERGKIAEYFSGIYTRNELQDEKPSLKFFYQVVKKTGDPALIYIGDDYTKDVLGAANAGLATIWYNPIFAHAPGHIPIHDAEFATFQQLPDILNRAMLPNLTTCQYWLMEQPCKHNLFLHSFMVAAITYQLALWCNENGLTIDPILVQRAAYLHDIGKLNRDLECQHHGEAGAIILRDKGYPQLAQIVEKHPLLCLKDENQKPQTPEEILVYLADKYTEGIRLVSLEERLSFLAGRYPDKREEILSIEKDLLHLQNACCNWVGFTPNEIVFQLQQALN